MDAATLAVICAIACGGWLLLVSGVVVGRLRSDAGVEPVSDAPRSSDDSPRPFVPEVDGEGASRRLLEEGIRSADSDIRISAITTLGRLGQRHEWASTL